MDKIIINQELENTLIGDLWEKLDKEISKWPKDLKSTEVGFICFDFYRSALAAQQLFYKLNNKLGFTESVCQLAYMGVPKPWETAEVKLVHSKLLEMTAPSIKQNYRKLIIFKLECTKEECLDWVDAELVKAKINTEDFITCSILKSKDCDYKLGHQALEVDKSKESHSFYWEQLS